MCPFLHYAGVHSRRITPPDDSSGSFISVLSLTHHIHSWLWENVMVKFLALIIKLQPLIDLAGTSYYDPMPVAVDLSAQSVSAGNLEIKG